MRSAGTFGELLRHHRRTAELTLEELAEASGVSVRAIGDMERGRSRAPQRRTVAALAEALGLAPDERQALGDAARAGRHRLPPAVTGAAELPRSVPDFTGRDPELAVLSRLAQPDTAAGPAAVVAVCGGPGLGKTTLAVRAAELLADRFPDGRLFVDLRGMDTDPLGAGAALSQILRALGVAEKQIPQDLHERSGRYRALMRDRRTLIVLDNAVDEAQVRPLLPGDGPGMAVITSRRSLAGLEGVRHLPLGELPSADAVRLLRKIIAAVRPDERVHGDLDELARLCGHFPLAIRIAANRLLSRPSWTTGDLLGRLADEERRLQALSAGDLHIAAAFGLSYEQLGAAARRTFRRLALIPGPDFGIAPVAALSGTGLHDGEEALEELVDLGLLQSPRPARYRLHDLVRLFARERLTAEEDRHVYEAAREAMNRWLLQTATLAGRWFEPGHGAPAAAADGLVVLDTPEKAQTWLETESVHWLPALRAAAAAGQHRRVLDVAEAMHWFSDRWIHWGRWTEVFGLSRAAAHALGDARAEATHLNYLSWALRACDGDHRSAVDHALRANALARAADDPLQEAWSLGYVAWAAQGIPDWQRSATCARQAADLFKRLGEKEGYPTAVNLLADALRHLGRPREALEHHLALLHELRSPDYGGSPGITDLHTGLTLRHIGEDYAALGQWEQAADHFRAAIAPTRRQGMISVVAAAAGQLGAALRRLGRNDEAREALGLALSAYLDMDEDARAAEMRDAIAELGGQGAGNRASGHDDVRRASPSRSGR